MAARLRFGNLHQNKPQDVWNNGFFFGQTRPKLGSLTIMHSDNQTLHISTEYQKYSSVKREAIWLTVKAWLKVGHLTGQ